MKAFCTNMSVTNTCRHRLNGSCLQWTYCEHKGFVHDSAYAIAELISRQNMSLAENQRIIMKQNEEILANQREAMQYAASDHLDLVERLKQIIQKTKGGR